MAKESGSQLALMNSLMGLLGNNLGGIQGAGAGGWAGSGDGRNPLHESLTEVVSGLMGGTSRKRMHQAVRTLLVGFAANWALSALPNLLSRSLGGGTSVPVQAEASKPAQIPAQSASARTSPTHYRSGSKVYYIPSASRSTGWGGGGGRYWS